MISPDFLNLARKSYQEFFWVRIDRGANLERRHSDCGNRRTGEHGRIRSLPSKNQRKRSVGHTQVRRIHLPNSRELSGRDHEFREPTWRRRQTVGSVKVSVENFKANRKASTDRIKRWRWSPKTLVDSRCLHLSSLHWTSCSALCAERRNIPYSTETHCVTRSTQTNLDVMQEKRIDDYWDLDENRSLSDSWWGCTKIHSIERRTSKRIFVVRWETDKGSNDNQTRHCVASSMHQNWEAAQNREEQEWANGKPKLDNARRLRNIYFIDLEDEKYKETMKNARRKLEVPMDEAFRCKKRATHSSGSQEIVARPKFIQQGSKDERRLKSGISWIHRSMSGTISTKRSRRPHSIQKVQVNESSPFGSQMYSMPQVAKIPDAKAAVDNEWNKLKTISAWQLKKVKSKKVALQEAQKGQKESPLCYIDGHVLSQECGVRTAVSNIQRSSRTSWWCCKRRLWSLYSLHWTRLDCFTKDRSKGNGVMARLPECNGQAAHAISAYTQVKMEDAPKLLRIPKLECRDILDTSSTPIQGVSTHWGCLYYNWGILSRNPGQSHIPERL